MREPLGRTVDKCVMSSQISEAYIGLMSSAIPVGQAVWFLCSEMGNGFNRPDGKRSDSDSKTPNIRNGIFSWWSFHVITRKGLIDILKFSSHSIHRVKIVRVIKDNISLREMFPKLPSSFGKEKSSNTKLPWIPTWHRCSLACTVWLTSMKEKGSSFWRPSGLVPFYAIGRPLFCAYVSVVCTKLVLTLKMVLFSCSLQLQRGNLVASSWYAIQWGKLDPAVVGPNASGMNSVWPRFFNEELSNTLPFVISILIRVTRSQVWHIQSCGHNCFR